MIIFIVSTCLVIICIIKWIFRDKILYGFADQIPGPKAFPIFGNFHKLLTLRSLRQSEEERFRIAQEILIKYENNDMTRFFLGPVLFVFINDPILIQQVLTSQNCIEKSFTYKFLRLDKGLLAAKPDVWIEHRKFLEASFQQDVIKTFLSIFIDSSNQMLASIDQIENKDNVDVFKLVSRCALTIVLASSFGVNANEVQFSDEIIKAVEELIKIISLRCHDPVLYLEPVYRITRTYFREKKYRKRCVTYLDNVLKDRRELITPLNNNEASPPSSSSKSYQRDEEMGINISAYDSERKTFIDHMISHKDKFSDDEIHDHIYTFVAGYEKVALQTFYTLLLLSCNAKVQEKLYNEITENLPDEKLEFESLNKLSYLDMVIKESMRLLPAIPIIARETQEEIEIGTRKIPKKKFN